MKESTKLLAYISGILILFFSFLAVQNYGLLNIPKYWIFLGILLEIGATYILTSKNFVTYGSTFRFLTISIGIIVILRLVWIIWVPTLPISDFEGYNVHAVEIATQIPSGLLSIDLGDKGFGYVFMLAIFYKIFGVHIIIAKILNIVLSVFIAILIFSITKNIFNEHIARITTLLFVFLPSQIMYTSVLASEHLYIAILLLGLYFIIRNFNVDLLDRFNYFYSGIMLGISFMIRQISIVIVIICTIKLFVNKEPIQKRVLRIMWYVCGVTLIIGIYVGAMLLLDRSPGPSDGWENSFMMGTNYDYIGGWNEKDGSIWSSNSSLEEKKRVAIRIGLQRIITNPVGFSILVFEKFDKMWADESYGAYWSTLKAEYQISNINMLYAISQLYYVWILCLSVVGCYKLKNEKNDGINLLLMIFLGFVLLHSFLEVQSRYHYPFEFIFLILAGYCIGSSFREKSIICK